MLAIKSPDLERIAENISTLPSQHDEFIRRNLGALGRRVAYIMTVVLAEHKVTGSLKDSVQSVVTPGQVEIGPTAKSGRWDRGLLLEQGTGPIPNLPFGPIAAWAEFRGIPAGPVWMTIKREGVKPHPFIDDVLYRGDTQVAIENTARRIGMDLIAYTFQGLSGAPEIGAQFIGGAE